MSIHEIRDFQPFFRFSFGGVFGRLRTVLVTALGRIEERDRRTYEARIRRYQIGGIRDRFIDGANLNHTVLDAPTKSILLTYLFYIERFC